MQLLLHLLILIILDNFSPATDAIAFSQVVLLSDDDLICIVFIEWIDVVQLLYFDLLLYFLEVVVDRRVRITVHINRYYRGPLLHNRLKMKSWCQYRNLISLCSFLLRNLPLRSVILLIRCLTVFLDLRLQNFEARCLLLYQWLVDVLSRGVWA